MTRRTAVSKVLEWPTIIEGTNRNHAEHGDKNTACYKLCVGVESARAVLPLRLQLAGQSLEERNSETKLKEMAHLFLHYGTRIPDDELRRRMLIELAPSVIRMGFLLKGTAPQRKPQES